MKYCYMASPVGQLLLAGTDDTLHIIGFPEGKGRVEPASGWQADESCFPEAKQQLDEYFVGKRTRFELKLAPSGTAFQRDVLNALVRIPYGETRTYQDIANELGKPKAVRAVGTANGRNPLPIVIPCHRVIGKDGSLTGFGGGLPTKAFLLELETGGHESFRLT